MKLFRKYLGIIIGIVFLTILLFHGRLRDYDEERYARPAPQEIVDLNKMKFEDVTKDYGLGGLQHSLFFANKSPIIQKYVPFITVNAYVAVADINNDGYMDLYYQETLPELPNRIFINEKGKKFTEITDKVPVLNKKGPHGTNIAIWADFNHDGKLDFFVGDTPCYKVFLQTEDLNFVEAEEQPDYCSVPTTLNLLDFNRDGNLDIAISGYFPPSIIHERTPILHQLIGLTSIYTKNGEVNVILLGDGKGNFDVLKLSPDKAQTTSLGVSYINDDMWPDLFLGNDYSFDEMYLNIDGKNLENVTDRYIPRFYHGFSGMNADFADYDMDGQLDLFVTNGWGPPSARSENLLWRKSEDGTHFIEMGKSQNVFRCGWAWGAKFADYDLDGDMDLFVTNGRARGRKAKSFDRAKNVTFLRVQVRSIPTIVRENLFDLADDKVPDLTNSDFQFFAFERNCMFSQHEGKFYDIAEASGVDDLDNGRALATLDIENDGKIDLVIGNTDGPLTLYRNISETNDNWIGFSLENELGLPYHGATLFSVRSDGKPLRKELFVGNGGRGISDPRIHFGLGQNEIKNNQIFVRWPDGKIEFFKVKLNQYNQVMYGTGKKSL